MPDRHRIDRPETMGHSEFGLATKGQRSQKNKTPTPGKSKSKQGNKSKPNTGKWIEIPSVDMPVGEVAYQALQVRLEYVRRMLPLATYQYHEDVEHVHQLRVGCRRAAAALSAFSPCMGRQRKPLRRLLKKLRAAAGPARDLDVLLLALKQEASYAGEARLQYLMEPFRRRREKIQQQMVAIEKKIQPTSKKDRLQKATTQCLNSIAPNKSFGRMPFGEFARQGLAASAVVMMQLGENLLTTKQTTKPSASLPEIEQLHELRIAAKRFRYSIELFHEAFPESLKTSIYPQIESIQEQLGTFNDHATMQRCFQWLMAKKIPDDRVVDLATRIVQQYEAVQAGRNSFLHWWTPLRASLLHADLKILLSDPMDQTTTHSATEPVA